METIAKGEGREKRAGRGGAQAAGRARKIGAATRYDFGGGVLTAYGGLLPLAALWEKLGLLALVDQWLTVKRQPDSLSNGQIVVSTVLLFFLGFSRYYQVRYVRQDEMVQGVIGGAGQLPVQSTYWRFLDSLRPHNEGQLMKKDQHGDEPTGVGSGEGEAEADLSGHRQHDEHGVRGSDGGAEGLQLAATWSEGAATPAEFCGRDGRMCAGQTAQW